ncbi:MAG TPA: hypothetical protein VH988_03740 [Thermoanaerobaculia bacterium]|jgi:hypothetical protein|nr:hypothetical protein [Thermoanaerobaculia bacterium]
MTDNPPQYIEPPPPPRAFVLRAVPPILNLVALILLLLGYIAAGEVFVGLALIAGLIALFRGGSATAAGPASGNTPQTPTNAR